jgi:hypothetical protein
VTGDWTGNNELDKLFKVLSRDLPRKLKSLKFKAKEVQRQIHGSSKSGKFKVREVQSQGGSKSGKFKVREVRDASPKF